MSSRRNAVRVNWTSLPVSIPSDFLSPLVTPPSAQVIDFTNSPLPEYEHEYAVILDNVLTLEECTQFIRYAEISQGAHATITSTEAKDENTKETNDGGNSDAVKVANNGWQEAMVNVGGGYEIVIPDYRNSDRIIWDHPEIMNRLWKRISQVDSVREYLSKLEGEKYESVLAQSRNDTTAWTPTKQGINERMRFLKYGAGQFFRQHCDGSYVTPDGQQESFYTMHLYLNNSAQALGISPCATDPRLMDTPDKPAGLLSGGATTFHSRRHENKRLDVDPKAGRVLIFQHRRLLHSGDDVKAGIKFTLRSDIMYERVVA